MARVLDSQLKHCRCCGCRAKILRWDCGCVTVEILDESRTGWCSDCDRFSDQASSCGKEGWPGDS